MSSIYEKLSAERKSLQAQGRIPDWYITGGWQMFKSKYMYQADDVKSQFQRISITAARHLPEEYQGLAYSKFFGMMWDRIISLSSPVLANMGTDRALPVSCQGQYIGDSIDEIYASKRELAIHTKQGFGTSAYLGDIRPRGSRIRGGGNSEGILPVFKGIINDMQYVSQGNTRRGSFAGYMPLEHGDFDEVVDYMSAFPDDFNLGYCISDQVLDDLNKGNKELTRRFKKTLKVKMTNGRGYFVFPDRMNRLAPEAIRNSGRTIKASNLCSEIALPADYDYTFTCVLLSMNILEWDKIKNDDSIFWATVFLDCVNSEFIRMAKNMPGMEKSVRFAEDYAALGLGQCGFHTYLQSKMIPYESLEAMFLSREIAERMDSESMRASKWLAEIRGEVKHTKGLGYRNATRLSVAPTKSSALLMGGVSEGINPDPAMSYTQASAAGDIDRINPYVLEILKKNNRYDKATMDSISANFGSVQHFDFFSDEQKAVFKTAFEINQEAHLRLHSQRSPKVDQASSFNFFLSSDEDPRWISHLHKLAFNDENVKSLYYCYTQRGVKAAPRECIACQ